jgi:O-antigen ligase
MVGAVLFAGYGTWMLLTWARSGGSVAPALGLLLACGFALVAARHIGSVTRLVVPSAALLSALVVAGGSKTGLFSSAPLSGPLEYVNADGAFYVQAAIAGLMLAFGARPWGLRTLGAAAVAFFAILPFVIHALAAAAMVLVLPAIALGSVLVGPRAARVGLGVLGLAFVGMVAATIRLAATYPPPLDRGLFQRAATRVVDGERLYLWYDAFELMKRHPVNGAGPGRYPYESPNAQRDPRDRWAHNEFLQQGAEGGVMGLALLALIFLWGFVRLSAGSAPDAITLLGAAALAALGIHATVDYVMHFPAIPILAAALVGTGMSDRR